jgi:hypothetical protein
VGSGLAIGLPDAIGDGLELGIGWRAPTPVSPVVVVGACPEVAAPGPIGPIVVGLFPGTFPCVAMRSGGAANEAVGTVRIAPAARARVPRATTALFFMDRFLLKFQ